MPLDLLRAPETRNPGGNPPSKKPDGFFTKESSFSELVSSVDRSNYDSVKEALFNKLDGMSSTEKHGAAVELSNKRPASDAERSLLKEAIIRLAPEYILERAVHLYKAYGADPVVRWQKSEDDKGRNQKGISDGEYRKYDGSTNNCFSVYLDMVQRLLDKNRLGIVHARLVARDFGEVRKEKRPVIIQLVNAPSAAFPGAEHATLKTHAFLFAGDTRYDFGKEGWRSTDTSGKTLHGPEKRTVYTPQRGNVRVYEFY